MAGPGYQLEAVDFDDLVVDPTLDQGLLWFNSVDDHLRFRRASKTVRVSEERSTYPYDLPTAVPGSGTKYLFSGTTATSSVPWTVPDDGYIRRVQLGVAAADPSRDYELQVVVNGVSVLAVNLPSGSTTALDSTPVALAAGDVVSYRMVRVSGSGSSTFKSGSLVIVFGE